MFPQMIAPVWEQSEIERWVFDSLVWYSTLKGYYDCESYNWWTADLYYFGTMQQILEIGTMQ